MKIPWKLIPTISLNSDMTIGVMLSSHSTSKNISIRPSGSGRVESPSRRRFCIGFNWVIFTGSSIVLCRALTLIDLVFLLLLDISHCIVYEFITYWVVSKASERVVSCTVSSLLSIFQIITKQWAGLCGFGSGVSVVKISLNALLTMFT